MCPTIVLRDGKPVLALGGAGGRKIPNSVFDVLMAFVGRDAPLPGALAGPRWHTEGDTTLFLSQGWPDAHTAYFKRIGYDVRTAGGALISAVARDPGTGEIQAGSR
jgi:gamma-glutamyltranspeptidase/glutathione hydrolase